MSWIIVIWWWCLQGGWQSMGHLLVPTCFCGTSWVPTVTGLRSSSRSWHVGTASSTTTSHGRRAACTCTSLTTAPVACTTSKPWRPWWVYPTWSVLPFPSFILLLTIHQFHWIHFGHLLFPSSLIQLNPGFIPVMHSVCAFSLSRIATAMLEPPMWLILMATHSLWKPRNVKSGAFYIPYLSLKHAIFFQYQLQTVQINRWV